ncbi:MAG: hypothetical protein ABSG22_10720 [Sedimentisphaerales bacterium]|jgi:hypothetical protein
MAKTKIAVKTRVREIIEKTNDKGSHPAVKFDALKFSEAQIGQLKALAEGKDEITLTIECVQEKLPGTE